MDEQQSDVTMPLLAGIPSYWQTTSSALTLSTVLPSTADVVVIGGGLLGTASSYWTARTGASVVLLEREGFAAGATGRNGGFVGCGPDEPYQEAITRLGYETARLMLDITVENRTLLRQVMEEETIVCDYREPGHLHLALTEEQLVSSADSRSALQQEGIQATLLDRAQVQACIQTSLGPDILGGLFVPDNGLLHSAQLVQGLGKAAQRYGAFPVRATVQHVFPDGQRVRILTNRGIIQAGSVIIALNAWTDEILPSLGSIITPIRGQMLAYQPLPPIFSQGITASLSNTEEYWQQTPDGTILLGGCRVAAPGYDVGIRSNQPTTEVQQALEQVFPRLFPDLALHLQVAQRWAGVMAFTPDLLPVIDQVPHLPHAWIVGGFCGHGMPYGLRVGQLLAEAITEGKHLPALQPFRLNRPTLQE